MIGEEINELKGKICKCRATIASVETAYFVPWSKRES